MKDNPALVGSIFIAIGLFSIAGAVANWEWFISSRRAWLFVKLFGRNGARIVYGLLGLAFVVGGIVFIVQGAQ